MKQSKEYTVLVINTNQKKGKASSLFTEALYKKLRERAKQVHIPMSIDIQTPSSRDEEITVWSIQLESSECSQTCYIKEFFVPRDAEPRTGAYMSWVARAPIRGAKYWLYKTKRKWKEASSYREKLTSLFGAFFLGILIFLDIYMFIYLFPFVSWSVLRPVRKMGTFAIMMCFIAIIAAVVVPYWQHFIPPLVEWVAQISGLLKDYLPATSQISVDAIFTVVASVVVAAGLASIGIISGIAKWIFNKINNNSIEGYSNASELSYLIDPVYASIQRHAFERILAELDTNSIGFQSLFIVSERVGTFLSYEVLSRGCCAKMSKPVYMLTHEFAMAGFRANPSDSLWELVDTVDWDRFSATTPDNLYWNHFGGFPLREWTIKLKSNPDNQFPTMQSKIVKWYGFRKNNSIIINRLVKILEQDILENQM